MRDSYYNDRAVGMPELTDAERVTLLTSQVARLKQKMEQIVSRKDQRIAELESIAKNHNSECGRVTYSKHDINLHRQVYYYNYKLGCFWCSFQNQW